MLWVIELLCQCCGQWTYDNHGIKNSLILCRECGELPLVEVKIKMGRNYVEPESDYEEDDDDYNGSMGEDD